MGTYTQSIREILQMNKLPSQKLTNVDDVYTIASQCLFDEIPVNVINSSYSKQFITGFTLHFMNEELGLETLPLWKIALNEKIYNNGSYINKIFENLDKEIFATYSVKNVEATGTISGQKNGTGTISNERKDNTTTTSEDNATHSQTVANTLNSEVKGGGTITNAKTGSDSITRTGTDDMARTGTDTMTQTGSLENAHTGSDATEGSNSNERTNTGTTGNDHNAIQISYDTPQGSLQNMRTPGGDAKGKGVSYANGQTYNYMSNAGEVNESNVQTDNTIENSTGTDASTTTYNSTNTETRALVDETAHNTTDTRTLNLTDTNNYGSIDTETRNTTDTTNKTDNTQTTGSDNKTGTVAVNGTVTDTETRNTTDTETGSHSDTSEQTDYTLNWEMLYKSIPLLNKVWEIFDDLFMLIY